MAKGWLDGVWSARYVDYLGRAIVVQVTYSTAGGGTNLDIVNPGLTGNREAGCLFTHVQVGRPGGVRAFPIPEGDFNLTAGQLNAQGFGTIEELTSANITVGLGS